MTLMSAGMQIERDLWRENGLAPPMPGTDAEKHWAEVDKAVPFTKVRNICHGALLHHLVRQRAGLDTIPSSQAESEWHDCWASARKHHLATKSARCQCDHAEARVLFVMSQIASMEDV